MYLHQVTCLHSSAHLQEFTIYVLKYLQLFKTHKQNKFLTVKCTFPHTGTQVSTYNLLLSRYCISDNLATLPGKLTLDFPFVFITTLALKILHLRILKWNFDASIVKSAAVQPVSGKSGSSYSFLNVTIWFLVPPKYGYRIMFQKSK